jgi:muramoyltetrapeptide carboxypeptidase LdcA involved in peptidoglycan recycling
MKPEFLKENPTIYLVAPSFGCTTEPYKTRLEASIEKFKSLGANVIAGKNIWLSEGVVSSNTSILRAKEINDAFLSNADAIISVGGGELMCEILPYIEFEEIKKNPKWFVGISYNTNLT